MDRQLPLAALSLFLLQLMMPFPSHAVERMEIGITTNRIQITSRFTGEKLVLFGAIPAGGDVVVVVRGEGQEIVVRRKERHLGIWVNASAARFEGVPGFYAVASTRPLDKIATPRTLKRMGALIDDLEFSSLSLVDEQQRKGFRKAIIRIKTRQGLYQRQPGAIRFLGSALFRTEITFPANVPVGNYTVEAFHLIDGRIANATTMPIFIKKTGIERGIYDIANQFPLLYGIIAIIIAAAAGWGAGAYFRRS